MVLVALLLCLFRCQKWWRARSYVLLPLQVCAVLSGSLIIRATWCLARYTHWEDMEDLNSEWMYTLERLPLLLQLSAFSAISLSWIASAESSTIQYQSFRFGILFSNVVLYVLSIVTLITEAAGNYKNQLYHIVTLLIIACCCLGLSLLFALFGYILRRKLLGSIHLDERILRSFNRIFWATILCSVSFGLRAIIFGTTTLLYNVFNICYSFNYIIYPIFVYAVPSTITSVTMLYIMDVDNADTTNERREGDQVFESL